MNTDMKKPTGEGNPTAGGAMNELDFPTGQRPSKAFETLAARYALAGHVLLRSDPAGGLAPYVAMRWGLIKPLDSLEQAEVFLRQIVGAA